MPARRAWFNGEGLEDGTQAKVVVMEAVPCLADLRRWRGAPEGGKEQRARGWARVRRVGLEQAAFWQRNGKRLGRPMN